MDILLARGSASQQRDKMSYKSLPLVSLSDEDSEEDELFNMANGNQFGDLELKLMPSVKTRGKTKMRKPEVIRKYSLYKVLCAFGIVLTVVMVISLIVTVNLMHSFGIVYKQTPDWHVVLGDSGSESCIHLMDVDDDGRQDILFGAARAADLNDIFNLSKTGSLEEFCKKKGREYPCVGKLMALRGYDGKKLWEIPTISGVLFIYCHGIDVNKDGKEDCIITGRQATIQAVDVSNNGSLLWLGDNKYFVNTWNIYQVLLLPDLDGDTVPEVLVCHGGDPNISSNIHTRTAGRLIVLSGATGKTLGERYLPMPENKESYMSPVMYTWKDGSQYILFGSGGETIPGDLLIISVPDLYRYIMRKGKNDIVPGVHGSYNHWPKKGRDPAGILTLYKGTYKGVMVPPVILDVNKDGIDDILLSAYEGRLTLYSGADLQIIWMTEFKNMESYSSPAPGYFDNDDTVDFMMHWSKGSWPFYNGSVTYVVSGVSGEVIWSMESTMYEMSSDLILKTNQRNRDVFLFKVKGRNSNVYMDATGVKHGVGVQRVIDKRYITSPIYGSARSGRVNKDSEKPSHKEEYESHHFLCTDDLDDYKIEVFLMDRTMTQEPVKLLEYGTQNYTYFPVKHYGDQTKSDKSFCIVMQPQDRTTGALGDVDGDGSLEAILMMEHAGELVDGDYSYDKMRYTMTINKINIEPVLQNKQLRTDIKESVQEKQLKTGNKESVKGVTSSGQEKDISEIKLLPSGKQTWTEYMGKLHKSWYKDN